MGEGGGWRVQGLEGLEGYPGTSMNQGLVKICGKRSQKAIIDLMVCLR